MSGAAYCGAASPALAPHRRPSETVPIVLPLPSTSPAGSGPLTPPVSHRLAFTTRTFYTARGKADAGHRSCGQPHRGVLSLFPLTQVHRKLTGPLNRGGRPSRPIPLPSSLPHLEFFESPWHHPLYSSGDFYTCHPGDFTLHPASGRSHHEHTTLHPMSQFEPRCSISYMTFQRCFASCLLLCCELLEDRNE